MRELVADGETGLTCLAMLLAAHGRDVPLAELRRDADRAARDSTPAGLIELAARHGMTATASIVTTAHLSTLPTPAILQRSEDRYVVLERARSAYASVIDPEGGRRRLALDEVLAGATGVALRLERAAGFRTRRRPPPLVRVLLRGAPGPRAWLAAIAVAAAAQSLALVYPLVVRELVDHRIAPGSMSVPAWLAAGLVGAAFAIAWLRGETSLRLRRALDRRLTGDTFDHLLAIPWQEVARRALGDLAHRLTTATALRDALAGGLVSAVLDAGFVLASLALLARVNALLATTAASIAALRLTIAVIGHYRVAGPARAEWAHQGDQVVFQMRALEQIESVKACGLEASVSDRFRSLHGRTLAATTRRVRVSAAFEGCQTAIGIAGPIVLLLVGARLMAGGLATVGDVVSAAALGALVLGPVASLAQTTTQLSFLSLWAGRLEDLLEVPRESTRARPSARGGALGVLSLERIRYRPARRGPWVLDDLDLELAPGDHVVVRGRSGAGKTTLVRVLLGLATPDAGHVRRNGRALGPDDFAALRARTGAVLQSPRLLPGTVRENLALLDPRASNAEIEDAGRRAAIHDELVALPCGYDTLLHDGQELSGGQIQRLVLARALLRRPELLVLDEPINQLDPCTAARVLENLAELGCTCLIVAHGDLVPRQSIRTLELDHGRLHAVRAQTPPNGTFSDHLPQGVG